MAQPRFAVPVKVHTHIAGFTPAFATRLVPNLAMWGVAAAGAVALFASPIPLFQKDVLYTVGLKNLYEDKTPDSDKPF
ncbi:hypothetical protein JCM1841_003372 [Sporobolomyces salmonicolor]